MHKTLVPTLKVKVIEVEGQVISSTEASLIRLHEKVNNNEMVCHNQN